MRLTDRARARFAGMAMLLALLTLTADLGSGSLLLGVTLAAALLLLCAVRLPLAAPVHGATGRPDRARAPGVILPSTHPDAAGHARPRAPGASLVAPA